MELKLLNASKRRAVFEIENNFAYFLDKEYQILLDGVTLKNINTNVFHVENLIPASKYKIQLKNIDDNTILTEIIFETEWEYVRLNIKKFGATGDGEKDDTLAIQAAIMACPENSTVYFPKGIYKVKTIFLKDNITIEMGRDSVIKGTENRENLAILPGVIDTSDEKDEYYLGSWEGNPLDSYASIITAINVKNVKFVGAGTIDGNATKEGWWLDAKKKRGAWRPKTVSLINSENIVFEGIKIINSPSWTVHPIFSKSLKFLNIEIRNPNNSPNTDGIDPESCIDVQIIGAKISVGDDCIVIKSGKIYLGKRLKRATENVTIRNCYMERGHGAVVIGSEIAGGVNEVNVEKCVFQQTDKGLRIKTRRGRGKDSILGGIKFKNIKMNDVKVPFALNSFYFCDPDGKSEYVGTKKALPVDERTPVVKDLTFKDIECKNAHIMAAFICGLPEKKIESVYVENVHITFSEDAEEGFPEMLIQCEKVKKQGIYLENIKEVTIKNLNIEGMESEMLITKNVDILNM